ncbi:GTP-binding protein lepa [Gloeophyllum trabeum ATCC 11539]|uniref:GTP-binding protein lepa n=1 Tax=Gloeophyllum trabeum (strain ATCC 11539 / FP-39264 / Madison 617) TaxID=670483 RepID=S7QF57_GLOTA|nr:GTP-binding protein lepa [Gloeophyllum trabeum ATCC 11539]EPQ57963.1 GTP-binding protein lepa [Gloeophyllum trabeum ATCC 11539]
MMHPAWRDACLKVLLGGRRAQLAVIPEGNTRVWSCSHDRGFHTSPSSRAAQRAQAPAMEDYPSEVIRNFSIIAHIDHGKSTLADRLLELTGTVPKLRKDNQQVLDKLKVERERGITVKAQTASMFYSYMNKRYLLNLIDTPGHVDFSWEVARSLAACQGALLLVDATQGVQAQTLSVFHVAKEKGLVIVPILNKIDLPAAQPELMAAQMQSTFGVDPSDILHISAKTGKGIENVLQAIIERIPPPASASAKNDNRLKAFLFDSSYDRYRGVISLVSIQSGVLQKGDRIQSMATSKRYEVTDLGIMSPEEKPTASLREGQVGWMVCGMKDSAEAHVGDTMHRVGETVEPMPGFKLAKAMVYAGIFPVDSNDFVKLEESIKRLTLTDRSVTVSRESSTALGQGCRLGFLGTLHMDVFRQRLEDEYDANVIITAPTVPYKVIYRDREQLVSNPTDFPDVTDTSNKVVEVQEPVVNASIIVPEEYLGEMMDLCFAHRAEEMDYRYLDVSGVTSSRILLKAVMPLSEIVTDFFDKLKSRSSGFASFDYEDAGYKASNLAKMVFLINGKPVDALALIVHRSAEQAVGRAWVKKLHKVIPRQLFEVPIQAAIGKKIVARETLSAMRADVTAGLYGGHHERKLKHLENQKESKRRMKKIGSVDLPQEAFFDILSSKS